MLAKFSSISDIRAAMPSTPKVQPEHAEHQQVIQSLYSLRRSSMKQIHSLVSVTIVKNKSWLFKAKLYVTALFSISDMAR